jgi:hypothetical protein
MADVMRANEFLNRLREELGAEVAARLLALHADPQGLRFDLADYETRSRIIRAWVRTILADPAARALRPASAIPRRMVQFWHAESPPVDIVDVMRTWPAANADLDHEIFSDRTALDFIRAMHPQNAAAAFAYATNPMLRSDLFRLLYLSRKGGIYIDADEECRAPIEPLLDTKCTLLLAPRVWRFADRKEVTVAEAIGGVSPDNCGFFLGNAPIACRAGHPVITAIAEFAVARVLQAKNEGRPAHVVDSTSAQMFTEIALSHLFATPDPTSRLDDVGLLLDWRSRFSTERWLSYKSGKSGDEPTISAPRGPGFPKPSAPAPAETRPVPRPPIRPAAREATPRSDEDVIRMTVESLKDLFDRRVVGWDGILQRMTGLDPGLFQYWYNLFDRGSEISAIDAIPIVQRLYYSNPSERTIRVLDVGAGTGGGSAMLQRIHAHSGPSHLKLDVTALELPDDRLTAFARYVHPNLKMIFADIFELNDLYDMVFCSNTVEHIEQPVPFVRRMQELARDYVLCITPFAEINRIEGHVNTIDMAFISQFEPLEVFVHTNVGWKTRGQCVIFVLKGLGEA